MEATLTERVFTAKEKQMLETPQLLYNFLKKEYAIDEEIISPYGSDKAMLSSVAVNLPGMPLLDNKSRWTISLSKNERKHNCSSEARIFYVGVNRHDSIPYLAVPSIEVESYVYSEGGVQGDICCNWDERSVWSLQKNVQTIFSLRATVGFLKIMEEFLNQLPQV